MDGEVSEQSSKAAEAAREKIVPALQELIDHGARVRPLILKGKHQGFIRGLHGPERRLIFGWYPDPEMRVFQILAHGTTLSPEEIESLNGIEARNLIRQIDAITDADFSLYPFISAFTTTSASELLWYGRGAAPATWSRNTIEIPGGWTLKLLAPPEHARLWAGVALLRERSKKRLDDTFNAAMVTRAMVGRGADRLYQSLKQTQKALQSDAIGPWTTLVRSEVVEANLKDGWGHAFSDDSREGVMRELKGMEGDDKHERLMATFYDQQMSAAREQQERIEASLSEATEGIEDVTTILTSLQVRSRDAQEAQDRESFAQQVGAGIAGLSADQERRERRAEGRGELPQL